MWDSGHIAGAAVLALGLAVVAGTGILCASVSYAVIRDIIRRNRETDKTTTDKTKENHYGKQQREQTGGTRG